jgi:hypothetical protein
VAVLAAALGIAAHRTPAPTDIEQAEADLRSARTVTTALIDEAFQHEADARGHRSHAECHRNLLDEHADTNDAEWVEVQQALADGHAQLARVHGSRRDNLFHVAAEHLRLLAEAESEILRAKDARDRGCPYPVAPRVRALLTPVLPAR